MLALFIKYIKVVIQILQYNLAFISVDIFKNDRDNNSPLTTQFLQMSLLSTKRRISFNEKNYYFVYSKIIKHIYINNKIKIFFNILFL